MMSKCKIFFHKTLLGQIFGFRPTFEFSSTLDKCISGPQRWGHERRPKRQVGFPKKATTFQDFGSLALTSLTARLIGLSGCLLLQNGLDCQRKIKVIFSWLEEENCVLDLPICFISPSKTTAGWRHCFALSAARAGNDHVVGFNLTRYQMLTDCRWRYWIGWPETGNLIDISWYWIESDTMRLTRYQMLADCRVQTDILNRIS